MSAPPAGQTRREFLLGTAALAVGGLGPRRASAGEEADNAVRVEAVTLRVPGLDPAHDGLRVAQLSDIHVGRRTPPARIQAALDAVNAFQPDLVALTGDYLSHNQKGLGLLREALGGLTAPTVAVLGNHDHWVDARGATAALEDLGYAVLRNQHTVLWLRGAPFTVIGVDDQVTGNADPAQAFAGVPGGSRLVLAHTPRTADLLRGADRPLLILSGHTHGGQVSIPILTPLLARLVAGETYLRGLYRLGAISLYVNRGVGNTVTTLRLNSDPEVTTATLRYVEE